MSSQAQPTSDREIGTTHKARRDRGASYKSVPPRARACAEEDTCADRPYENLRTTDADQRGKTNNRAESLRKLARLERDVDFHAVSRDHSGWKNFARLTLKL